MGARLASMKAGAPAAAPVTLQPPTAGDERSWFNTPELSSVATPGMGSCRGRLGDVVLMAGEFGRLRARKG